MFKHLVFLILVIFLATQNVLAKNCQKRSFAQKSEKNIKFDTGTILKVLNDLVTIETKDVASFYGKTIKNFSCGQLEAEDISEAVPDKNGYYVQFKGSLVCTGESATVVFIDFEGQLAPKLADKNYTLRKLSLYHYEESSC